MNRNQSTASSFVPPADLVEQRHDAPTVQSVWAAWLGNAGAGLGAGVVVAIVVNRLLGFAWQDTAIWGLCAGGLAFGALMVIRFSLDEVVEAWEWQRAMADVARLEDENAALRDRIVSLQQDLDYTRLQRAATAGTPTPKRVDVLPTADAPLQRDAEALLQRYFAGDPWARDAMGRYAGWTSTRWAAARDLLASAGILVTKGQKSHILPTSMADALTQLRSAQNDDD